LLIQIALFKFIGGMLVWLMVALFLAAYVALIYTVLPLFF